MTHNKYFVEDSGLLSDAEKICIAQALHELENQGLLEYRDGFWSLAAGVEIEEARDGFTRFPRQEPAAESQFAQTSTPSSGEPSETRVPPLEQAAQPSSQGPGSPDSDDEVIRPREGKASPTRNSGKCSRAIVRHCSKGRKSKRARR